MIRRGVSSPTKQLWTDWNKGLPSLLLSSLFTHGPTVPGCPCEARRLCTVAAVAKPCVTYERVRVPSARDHDQPVCVLFMGMHGHGTATSQAMLSGFGHKRLA